MKYRRLGRRGGSYLASLGSSLGGAIEVALAMASLIEPAKGALDGVARGVIKSLRKSSFVSLWEAGVSLGFGILISPIQNHPKMEKNHKKAVDKITLTYLQILLSSVKTGTDILSPP